MGIGVHKFPFLEVAPLANENGTDLICTHQSVFFEGADDPKMREADWRKRLDQLGVAMSK